MKHIYEPSARPDGAVRVRLDEVVDDRGVNEAGHDAGEAEVVRGGSMSATVIRDEGGVDDGSDCRRVDEVAAAVGR